MNDLRPEPVSPGVRVLLGVVVAAHGPLIAHLLGLDAWSALGLTLVTVALAWVVTRLFFRVGQGLTLLLVGTMTILGSAGMLVGWTADWGFLPVIREGVCLCGCPNSPLGLGATDVASWMYGGMVLASLPAGLLVRPEGFRLTRRDRVHALWLAHAPLCFGGMIAGMWAGAWAVAKVPVAVPEVSFVLTATAMNGGMVLGMLLGCRAWRGILDHESNRNGR